ncbi:PTS fructose transporter subunit IIA [Clostridium sp. JN-9]|uniref:PTS sugar transporter subunit IIA n=1 Tax=Clostridium sp. JN-9 TaxID=2507159 RepID=UPI0013E8C6A2|nr:PTS fructose transporter subunit IIA [Clostridium sp. JN-9]
MKDIALILLSHGNMAKETLKSAEMIVGKIENAYALSMDVDDGMNGIGLKLDNCFEGIGKNIKHVFVIADLLGGTPCNVAVQKLAAMENVTLISGLNLTMVIEFAMSQYDDCEKLKEHLIEVGRNGILDVLADLKKQLTK